MDIEYTKRWMQHRDIRDFLESVEIPDSIFITVYRWEESIFETIRYIPFLIGPRKLQHCLDNPSWGPSSLKAPKLVLPRSNGYFVKHFRDFYPEARFSGQDCEDPKQGIIAKHTITHLHDEKKIRVEVNVRALHKYLLATKQQLLLGIQIYRFSERDLTELNLIDTSTDFAGESSRYTFVARPSTGFSGVRSFFSSITGIWGRKLIHLPDIRISHTIVAD